MITDRRKFITKLTLWPLPWTWLEHYGHVNGTGTDVPPFSRNG